MDLGTAVEEKKQTRSSEIRARLNCLRSAVTAILCTNRAVYYTAYVHIYFTILRGGRAYVIYLLRD